MCEL